MRISEPRTVDADSKLINPKSAIGNRHNEDVAPPAFAREDLLAARLRVTKVLPYQRSLPPLISSLSLAVLSGLLLILAFPEWNFWSLGWVATAPLIMAVVRERRFWRSLFLGYVTGTLFYMGSAHWVTYTMNHYGDLPLWLSYMILLLFASLLGIFTGLFAGVMGLAIKRFGGWAILAAPVVWAASEWARITVIGVGWNALGYSQAFQPAIIQIARWGGVYAVSALLVAASTALVFALVYPARRRGLIVFTAAGALVLAAVIYGRAVSEETDSSGPVSIAIVQPNIPIAGQWGDPAFFEQMTARHLSLSEQAIQKEGFFPRSNNKDGIENEADEKLSNNERDSSGESAIINDGEGNSRVNILIWPESPIGFEYDRDEGLRRRLAEFTARNNVYLLISSWGFPQGENAPKEQYNSAIMIAPSGEKIAQYDKIALVPFGEYVPARGWIPFMDRIPALVYDIAPGKSLTLGDAAGTKIGTLICFEATRPDIARRMRMMGASVLTQISNELWYNSTAAARQMLAKAVFRAVENDIELIRATNSGLSARISNHGIVYDETPMFETATRVWRVRADTQSRAGETVYTRYGDLFAIVCVALSLLLAAATFVPEKTEKAI
ncbi:MAG: apolipoprotein N-acyltransferase [Blastocatellia bacterium]|nr:apolipoprotein N-acyltransferase [Blastocatellia bacterium]